MQAKNILIIGIGLIGGSIAMNLKRGKKIKNCIYGLSRDSNRVQLALKKGVIDCAVKSFDEIPHTIDLIILCTPVNTSINLLEKIERRFKNKVLVIDTGSTKEQICKLALLQKKGNLRFIGTHPLAGSEKSGFEFSSPDIFRNRMWVICPTINSLKSDIREVRKLILKLGAIPLILSPKDHDRYVSLTSHIPLVLASIYINLVNKKDSIVLSKIAAAGFYDSTRLASHSARNKTDIIITNRKNIINGMIILKNEINKFMKLLNTCNEEKIFYYFLESKKSRDNWLERFNLKI